MITRLGLLLVTTAFVPQVALAVEIRLPTTTARTGTRIEVPVTIGDVTGLNVTGIRIRIAYDATKLTAVGTETRDTMSEGWLTLDRLVPGEVWFVMANANPAFGSGVVVRILFDVKKDTAGEATLRFTRAELNDGHVPSVGVDGKVVVGATSVDTNGDGVVDIADLVSVARRFGERTNEGDVNGDGLVNIVDLVLIARQFGERF